MRYVLRVLGFANGQPCEWAGQYLEWYNPNLPDERQPMGGFTTDVSKAMKFASHGAALEEWRRVREPDPVRADGKPNRPLTAFTVDISPAE